MTKQAPQHEVELCFREVRSGTLIYLYECYQCHALYLNAAEHRATHDAEEAEPVSTDPWEDSCPCGDGR